MINEENTMRIRQDARIAIDALEAIVYSGDKQIHEEYLGEKVREAQNCLNFMKHFCVDVAKE